MLDEDDVSSKKTFNFNGVYSVMVFALKFVKFKELRFDSG
jgi:hypothetical protein